MKRQLYIVVAITVAACSTPAPSNPPGDGGAPVGDGASGEPSPGECMAACAMDEAGDMQSYCGTDRQTYTECQNLCGLVPGGVRLYQNACGADGMPQGAQPPYPADGDQVCDWAQQGTEWLAIGCDEDTGGGDSDGTDVATTGGEPTEAPAEEGVTLATVDHRSRYGSIKQQGSAPTCIAFAATAGLEGAVFQLSAERTPLSEMHLFSRYRTTQYAAMATAIRRGIATTAQSEALGFGYAAPLASRWLCTEADNCRDGVEPATPDEGVRTMLDMMAPFAVGAVQRVTPARGTSRVTAEQIREQLEQGKDLIVGFRMNDNWYSANLAPGGIIRDYTASRSFGHAVLLVGYVTMSERNYFIIRNSWGTSWAQNGYGYISFENAERHLQAAYNVTARWRTGDLPDCETGFAPATDGTCRRVCPDRSLADAMDVCHGVGAMCPSNTVADPANSCVRACATDDLEGDGYTGQCSARGCVYTINSGAMGCRAAMGRTCERHCPAPNCGLSMGMNEFGVAVVSCVPAGG